MDILAVSYNKWNHGSILPKVMLRHLLWHHVLHSEGKLQTLLFLLPQPQAVCMAFSKYKGGHSESSWKAAHLFSTMFLDWKGGFAGSLNSLIWDVSLDSTPFKSLDGLRQIKSSRGKMRTNTISDLKMVFSTNINIRIRYRKFAVYEKGFEWSYCTNL